MEQWLQDVQDHGVLRLFIKSKYLSFYTGREQSQGSALILALMVSIALAAGSLFFIHSAKLQTGLKLQDKAQVDIETAVIKINSLLQNPPHCNATFYGKPVAGGTLTQLLKCNPGFDCRTSISTTIYFDVNPASFALALDSSSPDNAKILSASYSIITAEQTGATKAPAVLKLDINFQKNLGMVNSARHTVNTVTYSFYANVLTGTYNYGTSVFTPSTTIVGCARNNNSISPY